MGKGKLIIEPKSPTGEDGYTIFSIKVKTELVDRIETIASFSGHSRNEL